MVAEVIGMGEITWWKDAEWEDIQGWSLKVEQL